MKLHEIFKERIRDIKILSRESSKEIRYALIPHFNIKKNLINEGQFKYEVQGFSDNFDDIQHIRDDLIKAGSEKIIFQDRYEIYLHAVQHSILRVRGKRQYQTKITYFFRIREIPQEIF